MMPNHQNILQKLTGEPPAFARIESRKSGICLLLNEKEIFPFWALSTGLTQTIAGFRKAGIDHFAPIIGLNNAWKGPDEYDFSWIDTYFLSLLDIHPQAFFMPRLHLNAPFWWKNAHPEELVVYGLEIDPSTHHMPERILENGLNWNSSFDTFDVSLSSHLWKSETAALLRAFLGHIENSPLRSRMMGYQVTSGMTGEWHYIGARFLPDYHPNMARICGRVPGVKERTHTPSGLLRDPEKEQHVIDFYHAYHNLVADTILWFAGIVKRETGRRVLCGTFYAYLLENIVIQEAGHLAPQRILESNDIDFIACPYSYMYSNKAGASNVDSDIVDDTGTWLGRARGIGGDGGYRVPVESVKLHNKLFIAELDPSTFIEPRVCGEGGSGSDTLEGSIAILRRDLAQVVCSGIGGWLYDFGPLTPPFHAGRGWYDDPPLITEIKKFVEMGRQRTELDTSSCAEIAAVYSAATFTATQHWTAEKASKNVGMHDCDFFNHWFLNAQARPLHRIGAPVDLMYDFDLNLPSSGPAHRLYFLFNVFYLSPQRVQKVLDFFRNSETTLVWFYAPAYIAPGRFDLNAMQELTGFDFTISNQPDSMMIDLTTPSEGISQFGVRTKRAPRFSVTGTPAEVMGRWQADSGIAFARTRAHGCTSIYCGSAPLPAQILRKIARDAGVPLWSDQADIIRACQDLVQITATSTGTRVFEAPFPLKDLESGEQLEMPAALEMEFGQGRCFERL